MPSLRAGPLLVLLATTAAIADEPTPVITVRAIHPDREMAAVLGLFRGAKAANPAAALAAWKRASREPDRLGKPVEAFIAALNPLMAGELANLDEARLAFWLDPGTGRLAWGATIPKDDGTIAALGTAMALSGGAAEEPIDGRPVDRLEGPGSTLMARGPGGVALSRTRDGLRGALRSPEIASAPLPPAESGWFADFDPRGLEVARSLDARRLAEAFRATECRRVSAVARLEGSTLAADISGVYGSIPGGSPTPEADWVDWVPADRTMAAFALAIDPRPEAWDSTFALADRIERVAPDRKEIAPIRFRLDLAARAFGVRTEVDVLPHLRGLSGWVGSGARIPDAGLVAIHLDDEGAARRLADRIKSRPGGGDGPGTGRVVGALAGRPIRLLVVGRSLLIAVGEGTIEASTEAKGRPDRSAGPGLRRAWGVPLPSRFVAAWPGRIPALANDRSPLAVALASAPPVVWTGHRAGNLMIDRVAWTGLDATVRRFLDLIPLDPPPDR